MSVSKVALRSEPEFCEVSISMSRAELGEAMGSIRPGMHKGMHCQGFRSDVGKDIKGMGGDDVREVRDYSNAVPGVRSLVGGRVNGQGRMRKSRGRVRM